MKQTFLINPRAAFFTRLLIAFLLACVGGIKIQAQDIISFSIDSTANANRNFMFPADLAGAPGVRTNNWNNIGQNVNGNSTTADAPLLPGSITNAAGQLVPNIGALWHDASGGSISDRGNGGTNDLKMFDDVADGYNESSLSGYGYLNITNIPYTNYNVYVYFLPDNGSGSGNTRGGVFCITNTPTGTNCVYLANQTNSGPNQFGQLPAPTTTTLGNYIQSTTTSIGSGGVAWSAIQGGNYGVFYGLTNANCQIFYAGLGNGSGAKDPFGNYVNGGSSAVRLKVAGFQIYKIPAASPTNLYLSNPSIILHAGNPSGSQVTVLANLSDGTIGVGESQNCTYLIDNTNVATVSATGVVKPGTNGTANLIIQLASAGLSLTNPVTVLGPTSLTISVASTNILVGNGQGDVTTATLNANYSDASNIPVNNYGFVAFNTSPVGVLTVTTNGTLTAVGVGTAQVVGSYDGLSVTSGVVTVAAYMAPGSVQSFAVKFTDSVSTHAMTFHDLSGVPGARFAYWNNMVLSQLYGPVSNTMPTTFDYHGTTLTNTVIQIFPGSTLVNDVFNTIGTATTNESTLFDTYNDQGMNNGTTISSTLIISNVPYSSYDVYFYFFNDNGPAGTNRPTEVVIDGVTQYRINNPSAPTQPDNTGNGYVIATPQPSGLPASVANVPFGNVVKFSSITDPTLTATWAGVGQDYIGDAAVVTRTRLVGVQLVKTLGGLTATNLYLSTPVPNQLPGNPATYALTVLADFSDGTTGGNITTLSGVSYLSSNTNVFLVDANGTITPGLTPGVATLTVGYQAKTLNASVTNLAPISVKVKAVPGTVYVDGSLGLISAQASAYANFGGTNTVNISGFNSAAFVDQGSPVCSMSTTGVITPNAVQGSASLGVSYLGATYVSPNAFTVSSIANAPVLAHQYLFTNAPSSTVVVDTIGGANGTVYGPLGTNKPITFDGSHVIFPGDGDYTTEPYVNLPAGLINQMGDVTIELWGGQTQVNTWARFFSFGSTGKGLDPHNFGAEISILELVAYYGGTGKADFFTPLHLGDVQTPFGLTNGAEYHMVMVYAPNAGTNAFYVNGVFIGGGTPTNAPLYSSVKDTVDWLGVSLANGDAPLAGWMNKLAIYEGVMSASQIAANYATGQSIYLPLVTVATNSVPMTFSIGSGNLNLSWPADHLGWTLQVQTNSLNSGLGTNWVPVTGSTSVTNAIIPINQANGSVFYRLTYHP